MIRITIKVCLALALLNWVCACNLSAQEAMSKEGLSVQTGQLSESTAKEEQIALDSIQISPVDQLTRTRNQLTGDWLGYRSLLEDSGITFKGTVTQFAFGVSGGIDNPSVPPILGQGDKFKYTGRGEYDFNVQLEKYLPLPRGRLLVGVQHWWGEFGNVSFNTGALVPAVLSAIAPPVPNNQGELFLTDFLYTQPVSEGLVVFAGKKNILGTADQDIFAGGDGTDQFMNQALVANPAYLLALPYSSFTMGMVMPSTWGSASLYVWDPTDRTKRGIDRLFAEGILLGTQLRLNTKFFNKPGEHHVGGIWKNVDQIDLSGNAIPPVINFPGQAVSVAGLPTRSDGYTIYYGFDQYFQVFPGERASPQPRKPPRGWGLFGRASISDGNPTPYEYFLSLGLGGDSRLANDRGDTFGLGWYYNGVSRQIGPVPEALLGRREGWGMELYYRFMLTPWLSITPDVQFIKPGFGQFTNGGDAFVYGFRVNMRL